MKYIPDAAWSFFQRAAAPRFFYALAGRLSPWCAWLTVVFLAAGWTGGLVYAPADYQQGDGFRIIYAHVPAAWMSLLVYVAMALNSAIFLVWRIKAADVVVRASALAGASFTFLALVTGAIWGKPMWGTWWQWDARLTSELILLFLYLGYIGLVTSLEDRRLASRAGALLVLVGSVNIPIIHYSVLWWNTLHQPASISLSAAPAIHISMLIPLLLMAAAFLFFYCWMMLLNARAELLEQEKRSRWVRQLVGAA